MALELCSRVCAWTGALARVLVCSRAFVLLCMGACVFLRLRAYAHASALLFALACLGGACDTGKRGVVRV